MNNKKCKSKTIRGTPCQAKGYLSGYCLTHYKKELRKLVSLNEIRSGIEQR